MVLRTYIRYYALQRHRRRSVTASSSPSIQLFTFQLQNQRHYFSSRSNNKRRSNSFQLDALPFRVAPHEAYIQFENWAINEQGLGPFLNLGSPFGSAKLSAAYTPFWYFDLNVRWRKGRSTIQPPEPFRTAYPNSPNGVVHVPGLASYAGFTYRRSLIDPVHNTTPVFLKEEISPFGTWMLEPLKYNNNNLDIFPDPWNATRERSLSIIYDELVEMGNEGIDDGDNNTIRVEIERLGARRIYMPTYVVDYTILGVTYRAFISGCDSSVSVSAISHKTTTPFADSRNEVFKGASSFLSQKALPLAGTAVQFFGLRPIVAIAQLGFNILARVAMKLHIVGLFGGLYLTYQKIVRPYLHDKETREKWERQRDHEAQMHSFSYHEFRDYDGLAQRYFRQNQKKILRSLGGEEGREQTQQGTSWYEQWEEWAREQFEEAQREASRAQQEWQRQQQQQGRYQGGQRQQTKQQQQYSQQKTGRQYKQKAKQDEFKWDFDANDPWQVLGVPRGASKEEVSKAFRRVSICVST